MQEQQAKRQRVNEDQVADEIASVFPALPRVFIKTALEKFDGDANLATLFLLEDEIQQSEEFEQHARAFHNKYATHDVIDVDADPTEADEPPAAVTTAAPVKPTTDRIAPEDCDPGLFYLNYVPFDSSRRAATAHANANSVHISDLFVSRAGEALTRVIMTTYELDLDWLIDCVPVLLSVPVLVLHGTNDTYPTKPHNIMLSKPPLPIEYGCNHGKSNRVCNFSS
jgi:hypothetical protein